ncbi:N-acetylglucosaminyl transferase component-domain-containing protein, partial [Terfezia claveryi]
LAILIFIAGYITAQYSLVQYGVELLRFAWEYGVVGRILQGFSILSLFFFLFLLPVEHIATREVNLGAFIRLMGYSNVLMRVFWPLDAPRREDPGLIVGWRNSERDIMVVTILHDIDKSRVEHELRIGTLFRKSHYSLSRIFDLCGGAQLQALGVVNENPGEIFMSRYIHVFTNKSTPYPQIFCPASSGIALQVILYERPHPRRMQYLSLEPISLALSERLSAIEQAETDEERAELREKQRKAVLVEKLKQHSVARPAPTLMEESLSKIVDQINCSYEWKILLQENVALLGSWTRSRRSLSVSERVVESAQSLWQILLSLLVKGLKLLWPLITKCFILLILFIRLLAESMLRVLEWRLRPELAALKDISATAQQFDIRLQQFCYWPIQYTTLRKRRNDWESVTTSHPDYIRFYNSLWLVANDIIIGIALGSYIIENANQVAYNIDSYLNAYTIDGLTSMINWLMGWPAGLKLNNDLAKFLGDLFLWVINYWAGCVISLRPYLISVIYGIGYSSLLGASMPIALFSDLLSILTLHIYSFYIASARIYNWQLTIIISLFHLFRGKKRNVLRNRIDSCDYDLDQLLLGTILFTLLFFLLPTVLVFYLTFASARMIIISLKAMLETFLACLNHFPLFALMLRVKDSKRLPGGIRFELRNTADIIPQFKQPYETLGTSYIHLRSIPLSFGAMYHQYFQLGSRIRKHYVSPTVILCLATGRFVPPIHRKNLYSMQYSMLPTIRAGVKEVWRAMIEDHSVKAKTA